MLFLNFGRNISINIIYLLFLFFRLFKVGFESFGWLLVNFLVRL